MGKQTKCEIEVLSGPLDGHIIVLESETEWTREKGSLLSFPWDNELGTAQARFKPVAEGWRLEVTNAKRGTHVGRPGGEIRLPAILQVGDLIKASETWMRIRSIS